MMNFLKKPRGHCADDGGVDGGGGDEIDHTAAADGDDDGV